MPQLRIREERGKGILLSLVSTLCFGLMQVFVAMTGKEVGVMEQTFFRNLICLFIVGGVLAKKRLPFYGERKYQLPLFIRSVSGFLGVLCLFYAARNASQADVTILCRLSMFTVTAASVFFLHEKLHPVHIPVILLAFIGAWIAAAPHFDSSFLPLLSALGNAVFSSVAYILVSYFSGRVHPLTVVMYFCTVSTALSALLMRNSFVVPAEWDLFCLLMIGAMAASAQISMTYSYLYAPAGKLSIYSQSAIVINSILGFIFLGEVPSLRTALGGTLVIAASLLLFFCKQRTMRTGT